MNNAFNFKSISIQIISFLVVTMLGLSLIVHKAAGYSALLILLISLLGLWVTRKESSPKWQSWEKWWILSIFLFFGLIVLDVLVGHGDISVLDSPSRLILAIPVFIYIRKVGVDIDSVWVASAIGSVLAGFYAYYQHIILGANMAEGFTSHIYFGQVALILTLFSFVGLMMNKKIWVKGLLLVAVIIGFYAVLASGSRGGWVALPAIAILFLSVRSSKASFWKKTVFLSVLTTILYAAYQAPQLPVKSRVDAAVNNVAAYYQEGKVNTSSGFRLEMWKAAWLMTKDSNFLGVGEAQYHTSLTKLIKENKVDKRLDYFSAPHSQYFNSLSEQGILGLASLLLMLLIPLRVALRKIKENKGDKFPALFVAILIIAYMDFMLTAETVDRQLMIVIYAFILSILAGSISKLSFENRLLAKS
ncbi:MAG: O-antigen ligase family protein [Candidatus Thioglobus sp.]|nr:O-antigen ligase family protein [Candidatus Thioglobus sp.]